MFIYFKMSFTFFQVLQYFGENTLELKLHIYPCLHQLQNSLYL